MLNSSRLPIALGLIILVVAGVFLSTDLATGQRLHYDEFYSLERSYGFEKHQDWLSVYSGNERTAKKPPLQYWLNGVNLKMGLPELLSLRLWTFIFYMGLMLITAMLSYRLSKDNPWVFPATILLMCSSVLLIRLGRSGMLDIGMSFFLMGAILALVLARNNPKFWVLCGLFVGLGALQKAPVALIFIAILLILLSRLKAEEYQFSNLRKNRSFLVGGGLAILPIALWHILQASRYGSDYYDRAFKKEMFRRFSPTGKEGVASDDMFKWVDWLWGDLSFIGILLFVALLCVLFVPRFRENKILFAFSIVSVGVLTVFTFASGNIYDRYLMIVTPLMMVVFLKVISDVSKWQPAPAVVAAVFLGLSYSNVQSAVDYIHTKDSFKEAQSLVALLDGVRNEKDHVVIDRKVFPPGAYGFFGKSLEPYKVIAVNAPSGPEDVEAYIEFLENEVVSIVNVTSKEGFEALKQKVSGVKAIGYEGDFVAWRYTFEKQ